MLMKVNTQVIRL